MVIKILSFLFVSYAGTIQIDNTEDILQSTDKTDYIMLFSNLVSFAQNFWWLLCTLVFIIGVIIYIIRFRNMVNQGTRKQIDSFINEKKYIPELFVETNNTKEVLRYFIYGHKWKERVINQYNDLFANHEGEIIKNAFKSNSSLLFKLNKHGSVKKLKKYLSSINKTLEHNITPEDFSSDFKDSIYITIVNQRRYQYKLNYLTDYYEALDSRYMILTGSAGNGKTNLLCSICELILKLRYPCIFINSRDVSNNIDEFFYSKVSIPKFFKEHFQLILSLKLFLGRLFRQKLFIVIDAVNENNTSSFLCNLPIFINKMLKYKNINIIVSCRNEYFDLKYKEVLVKKIQYKPFVYDVKSTTLSKAAEEKLFNVYSKYYNFQGHISESAKSKLLKQLLLLRMFFETHQDSTENTLFLDKYAIFKKYIEQLSDKNGTRIDQLTDRIASSMIKTESYNEIPVDSISENIQEREDIKKIADESILISRKIKVNENTIIESDYEVIYFVFDEMRDYCLAKYILYRYNSNDAVPDAVYKFIDKLNSDKPSCFEGIVAYLYEYYKSQRNYSTCDYILAHYTSNEYSALNQRRYIIKEIGDLGIRMILNSSGVEHFEKQYILSRLINAPDTHVLSFVNYVFESDIYGGHINLDLFIDIIFLIKSRKDVILILKYSIGSRFDDILLNRNNLLETLVKLNKQKYDSFLRFFEFLLLLILFFKGDFYEIIVKALKKYPEYNGIKALLLERVKKTGWLYE